ncbi:CDP-diacylglycerol--glycerol-3-phosphate 3-phosphatidyltransferase, mitochondrial-like [Ruditapes philippinarum]|uniref:CDP-diacylglycerol--glycerol-3-phosphate 3-phosphatidyltransferase, mitochondrial-like n=1 Tax=Ruditapes philippinarum TaxID=129788 RepID=UPI00295BD702|nr:CDP-diacylglycerol--glycerol-3-phosphate 3-phosphatidyltransferase, mitochondrial-like [Ruditapes philippinarum]
MAGRKSKYILDTLGFILQKKCGIPVFSNALLLLSRRNKHCLAEELKGGKEESHTISSRMSLRPALHKKFGWMNDHVPCFGVDGDNITVINQPADFYNTFKDMTRNAKRRIVIASLYLGTDRLENELIKSIESACERAVQNNNDSFEVHVLLDYTRGSRGVNKSSRTMLLPLLEKYGDKVQVYLYHTPDLRGFWKKFLPERMNEIVGLNHMKIYLADNDFIISGANLSDSYFTNRQDRYIQFRTCPEMSNYLCDLVCAVSRFSFHLQCNNTTVYPEGAPHPYDGSEDVQVFKDYAEDTISKLNSFWKESRASTQLNSNDSDVDTWLYPLIQMGPFKIKDDEVVTERLFTKSETPDRILLASGYFNLTSNYVDYVINKSNAVFRILTASPETNGFFGSSGISGYVPHAYTQIARRFYEETCKQCEEERISLYEYYKLDWTFHVKGLWYYIQQSNLPVLTLIGSPNFGYRSIYRDLECQVAVLTTNTSLQNQLKQEHERLYGSSYKVTAKTFQHPDRYVPLWVRFVTRFLKNLF